MASDSKEENLVHCDKHGNLSYGFVCRHLVDGSNMSFFEIPKSEIEEHPWAWCSECDAVIVETDGDEEKIDKKANWSLICLICFADIKAKNRLEAYIAE